MPHLLMSHICSPLLRSRSPPQLFKPETQQPPPPHFSTYPPHLRAQSSYPTLEFSKQPNCIYSFLLEAWWNIDSLWKSSHFTSFHLKCSFQAYAPVHHSLFLSQLLVNEVRNPYVCGKTPTVWILLQEVYLEETAPLPVHEFVSKNNYAGNAASWKVT